jgi:hypothetical protein
MPFVWIRHSLSAQLQMDCRFLCVCACAVTNSAAENTMKPVLLGVQMFVQSGFYPAALPGCPNSSANVWVWTLSGSSAIAVAQLLIFTNLMPNGNSCLLFHGSWWGPAPFHEFICCWVSACDHVYFPYPCSSFGCLLFSFWLVDTVVGSAS